MPGFMAEVYLWKRKSEYWPIQRMQILPTCRSYNTPFNQTQRQKQCAMKWD